MSEASERKDRLIAVYNEEVYEKLGDVFDFRRCNGRQDKDFHFGKIKKDWVWMSIPSGSELLGREVENAVHFVFSEKDDKYEVKIAAEVLPAIHSFIDKLRVPGNVEKLIAEYRKLPDFFDVQATYRTPPPGRDRIMQGGNIGHWDQTTQFKCNAIAEEDFKVHILDYLIFHYEHRLKDNQYPTVRIARAVVKKEEITSAFKTLKPLHRLLFNLDTELSIKKNILREKFGDEEFESMLEDKDYDLILEEVRSFDRSITVDDLKELRRRKARVAIRTGGEQ